MKQFLTKASVIGVICFLAVELGVRLFMWYSIGPDLLFYGTNILGNKEKQVLHGKLVMDHKKLESEVRDVHRHTREMEGYSKYTPHQTRRDTDDEGNYFDVTINKHGFRGADYEIEKAPGVIRVVTLGASSTFGYGDRDDETYPHYLSINLNERCPSKTFEVINLAIPHSRTENVVKIFEHEGLPLQPDYVSYYGGAADTARDLRTEASMAAIFTSDPTNQGISTEAQIENLSQTQNWHWASDDGVIRQSWRWVRDHFISVSLVNTILRANTTYSYSHEQLETASKLKETIYLGNISLMHHMAEKAGARFIAMTQQTKSMMFPREEMNHYTYEQELQAVKAKMQSNKPLPMMEFRFLLHAHMMQELRAWASAQQINFIDIIKKLDSQRSELHSWVHLTPKANRVIADALADEILGMACPQTAP